MNRNGRDGLSNDPKSAVEAIEHQVKVLKREPSEVNRSGYRLALANAWISLGTYGNQENERKLKARLEQAKESAKPYL